jgi:hypothetical protein
MMQADRQNTIESGFAGLAKQFLQIRISVINCGSSASLRESQAICEIACLAKSSSCRDTSSGYTSASTSRHISR